jgi:hypothetical protein
LVVIGGIRDDGIDSAFLDPRQFAAEYFDADLADGFGQALANRVIESSQRLTADHADNADQNQKGPIRVICVICG